jgi:hypothetical protein
MGYPTESERVGSKFWQKRGVNIINRRLADYVAALGDGFKALKQREAPHESGGIS